MSHAERAESEAAGWNALYPVGTRVRVQAGFGEFDGVTTTTARPDPGSVTRVAVWPDGHTYEYSIPLYCIVMAEEPEQPFEGCRCGCFFN